MPARSSCKVLPPPLILVAIEDITVNVQAQDELRRTAEFDEAVFANMGEGLYTVDTDGRVTRMNLAAEKLFGWNFEELRGRKMHEMTHHHHPDGTSFPAEECAGLQVLKEGKVLTDHPDVFIRKDGTFFDVIYSSAPLTAGNEIVGLVVVFRDVSERNRAEEANVALKNQLAEDLAAMQRLHEISIRLVGHGDLQVLLEEILNAAGEITGADFGTIQRLDRATGVLKIVAQRGFDRKFQDFFDSVHAGLAASGTALEKSQRVIVEDVANDPIFRGTPAREVMLRAGALAVQSTPLVSRSGETLGMFSTHYRSPRRPSERDLQRLDLLARQASDLIERNLVEEALRESQDQLARELSATKQLQSISASLLEGGTTEALYSKILDAAVAIMHSDMASMQSLDEDQEALRLLAWRGSDASFGQIYASVRLDTGTTCETAMRSGQRVIVSDVEKCDFIGGEALENYRKMDIGAVQSTPLFSRSGRPMGMISTHWRNPHTPVESDLRLFDILARQVADLIERKQAEDARGRLAAIVESSADAIVSKDLNGIIQTWNSGAERLFGYTPQEAIGQPVTILIPPDHLDEEPSILERIRHGLRVEHYETIRRRKDGTLLDISLTVSPIFNENGQVVGASKIARDITDSKRIEQERRDMAVTTALRNTEAELARIARALTVGEMATSIAHEVNQPLAAVVTNAEACLRWLGGKEPSLHEAQESLALIVRDANRASEVIRRIRQFLKKDTQLGPLDINAVIQEALDFGRDQLLKSQVAARTELADGLPAVRGDRIQLQQVMLNLIMNGKDAMSSVEDRPRELVVTSQKSGADSIRVAVRDSGSGATLENMNRMFNPFFTTKPSGIGMGLSISRSIIEALGGRIWAEPNDGPGLTVHFSLPAASENPS